MNALPRALKRTVMVNFLWDDVFYKFRFFFDSAKNTNSKYLYDIAFGIYPKRFDGTDEDRIIYVEGDNVTEMFLIDEGSIAIGYYLEYPEGEEYFRRELHRAIFTKSGTYILDFNVVCNEKSDFVYMAEGIVNCWALSKKFLLGSLFKKYPEILDEMRVSS